MPVSQRSSQKGRTKRLPDLIKRAHAWIFFGSDIGSPRRQNRIQASDDALEQWAVAVMEREGLAVDAKVAHDATARGEAGAIQRGGGRCFTVQRQTRHKSTDMLRKYIRDVSLFRDNASGRVGL